MSSEKASAVAPFAAVAATLGVCCGLPLLASMGVLGTVAGLALRSWILVALAAAVGVVGVVRWRGTGNRYPAPRPADNLSPRRHDTVLSPTNTYPNAEESK